MSSTLVIIRHMDVLKHGPKLIDISGQRFGRLVAVEYVSRPSRSSNRSRQWLFKCDCGNTKIIAVRNLKPRPDGRVPTISCGCYQLEVSANHINPRNLDSDRPEYQMWERAKHRAKRQGVPFDIAWTDIAIPEYCPMLGIKMEHGADNHHNSPSLDKIVPRLGYIVGNIQVISKRANRIKTDASFSEFELMYLFWKAQHDPTLELLG